MWIALAQAAACLRMPYPALYHAMLRGDYPCERRGNRWFIQISSPITAKAPGVPRGAA